MWNSNTKRSEVQLLELVEDVDYLKVIHLLNGLSANQKTPEPSLSKTQLNQLLLMAQRKRIGEVHCISCLWTEYNSC